MVIGSWPKCGRSITCTESLPDSQSLKMHLSAGGKPNPKAP